MIPDCSRTNQQIIDWIKGQLTERNKKALVINISYSSASMPSALVMYLCKRASVPVTCVLATTLPLIESGKYDIRRVCEELNIHHIPINLKTGPGWAENLHKHTAMCSKDVDGLIAGIRCKNEVLLARQYNKFEPVDILPLADLKMSEVYQLFDSIGVKAEVYRRPIDAEIPNLGVSNEELEWLDELSKLGDLLDLDDPSKHPKWYRFTVRQKEVIAKIHQEEKLTRHKHNPNLPICRVNR